MAGTDATIGEIDLESETVGVVTAGGTGKEKGTELAAVARKEEIQMWLDGIEHRKARIAVLKQTREHGQMTRSEGLAEILWAGAEAGELGCATRVATALIEKMVQKSGKEEGRGSGVLRGLKVGVGTVGGKADAREVRKRNVENPVLIRAARNVGHRGHHRQVVTRH
jgi:hypothetical protein